MTTDRTLLELALEYGKQMRGVGFSDRWDNTTQCAKAGEAWDALVAAIQGAVKVEHRVCTACDWRGKWTQTVSLGEVGPLCPQCHETTEALEVSFCGGIPVIEYATEKLDWSDVE
jgi:hypothetical protein